MKTFQDLRETLSEEVLEEATNNMPVMLVLKRKSIRIFPDGIKVGIYYSDRLKKYVSIPFGQDTLNPEKEDSY